MKIELIHKIDDKTTLIINDLARDEEIMDAKVKAIAKRMPKLIKSFKGL